MTGTPTILCLALLCLTAPLKVAGQDRAAPKLSDTLVRAESQAPLVSYTRHDAEPINISRKLTYYLMSAVSVRNFVEMGLIAGAPNLPSAPKQPQPPAVLDWTSGQAYETAMDQYGNGMDDWRRSSEVEVRYRAHRAAAGLATAETRMFLSNLLLPVLLRQDPRYVPASLDDDFGARIGHAISGVMVAHTDHGHVVPNVSKLAGTTSAAILGAKVYSRQLDAPGLNTSSFVMRYTVYSMAADIATNVARELVRSAIRPDLRRQQEDGPATADNYYPLTTAGKLFYWARTTYSPRHFLQGGLMAGLPNIADQPKYPATPPINTVEEEVAFDRVLMQYGTAVQVWRQGLESDVRYHGRRFAGGFSESETQSVLSNFLLPAILRMEPRYIPLGPGHSAGARIGHALAGIAVTRINSGGRTLNLPVLAGTVGAAFLARDCYYPALGVDALDNDRVLGKTVGFNFAADSLFNLVSEFSRHRGF